MVVLVVLGGAALGVRAAAAQSRFLSYDSEAECAAGHVLGAPLCRSAFANAQVEFEAKTPSFSSKAQCAKSFGDCAPWPPGSLPRASFRPHWSGVDIVDTPHEKSVTPAAVSGLRRLRFAPQPLTEFRQLDVRVARPNGAGTAAVPTRTASRRFPGRPEPETPLAPSAPPPPGSGFKLEDGVLTFPAPARFQPKNLPKQP